MVMVPAGREEQRAGVAPDDLVEAERFVVERRSLLEIADVQVHVADGRPVRHPGPPFATAGRYEVRAGDQVTAVVVTAGEAARLALAPGAPPKVGDHRLRWVPPTANAAGFWLAEREVTVECPLDCEIPARGA